MSDKSEVTEDGQEGGVGEAQGTFRAEVRRGLGVRGGHPQLPTRRRGRGAGQEGGRGGTPVCGQRREAARRVAQRGRYRPLEGLRDQRSQGSPDEGGRGAHPKPPAAGGRGQGGSRNPEGGARPDQTEALVLLGTTPAK